MASYQANKAIAQTKKKFFSKKKQKNFSIKKFEKNLKKIFKKF